MRQGLAKVLVVALLVAALFGGSLLSFVVLKALVGVPADAATATGPAGRSGGAN